jgi:hypothetical protein
VVTVTLTVRRPYGPSPVVTVIFRLSFGWYGSAGGNPLQPLGIFEVSEFRIPGRRRAELCKSRCFEMLHLPSHAAGVGDSEPAKMMARLCFAFSTHMRFVCLLLSFALNSPFRGHLVQGKMIHNCTLLFADDCAWGRQSDTGRCKTSVVVIVPSIILSNCSGLGVAKQACIESAQRRQLLRHQWARMSIAFTKYANARLLFLFGELDMFGDPLPAEDISLAQVVSYQQTADNFKHLAMLSTPVCAGCLATHLRRNTARRAGVHQGRTDTMSSWRRRQTDAAP